MSRIKKFTEFNEGLTYDSELELNEMAGKSIMSKDELKKHVSGKAMEILDYARCTSRTSKARGEDSVTPDGEVRINVLGPINLDYEHKVKTKNDRIKNGQSPVPSSEPRKLEDFGGMNIHTVYTGNHISGSSDKTYVAELNINNNRFRNFDGGPLFVNGAIRCKNNYIETLKGMPGNATSILADNNKLLTLEGLPNTVNKVSVNGNDLVSLEGLPEGFDLDNLTLDWRNKEDLVAGFKTFEKTGSWVNTYINILGSGKFDSLKDEQKEIVLGKVSKEDLEAAIEENPVEMVNSLKTIWNKPFFKEHFGELKTSDFVKGRADAAAELNDLGF